MIKYLFGDLIQEFIFCQKEKVLFLTPTKPLANQIFQEFKDSTNIENIELFTGAPTRNAMLEWFTFGKNSESYLIPNRV